MKRLISCLLLFFLLAQGFCLATDRSDEVNQLLAGLNSASRVKRVTAAKLITRSGLQDADLYRRVAEIIEANYRKEYEKELTDEIAWMCKALAASGEEQYKQLLQKVYEEAPSVKLKRYAKQSVELFERYRQRSEVLNSEENWDADLSAEENRLINMLRADDILLRRDAAKTITRKLQLNEKVFAAASETLRGMTAHFQQENTYIDTMAWLCKALAASGDEQYVAVLEQTHDAVSSTKLRTYAKKAIDALR